MILPNAAREFRALRVLIGRAKALS